MPRYVAKVVVETEFDEQKVRVELRPLLYADALKLRRYLKDDGAGKATADEEVFVEYAAMIPPYLLNGTQLKDADGADVPTSALAETFFTPYLKTLLLRHLAAGRAADPSRPAEPPDASSAGSLTESASLSAA